MSEDQAPIQRIVGGAVRYIGSTYAARIVNNIVYVLLLNLLIPAEFGKIVFAISILVMIVSLRDLGLHYALLHNHDRVDEFAPTHFILSTLLGAISTLFAFAFAFFYNDVIAAFTSLPFGIQTPEPLEPIVAIGIAVFAGVDFLRTAALTADTQLRRDLEFGRLALAHASATIVAALVGLAIAYMGGGSWALIFGFFPNCVSYVVVYCAIVWLKRPPPLARLGEFDRDAAREMLRYGLWYYAGGVSKGFILHYDKLIVGAWLSLDTLGLYSQAHAFSQIPTGAITMAIVSITGAVYARYQKDHDQLSAAFRRTLRLILRTTIPISLILILEADGWIRLFKPEWVPAAPILQWLILYSLCRPILDDLNALLLGVGAPRNIVVFITTQAGILLLLAPILTWKLGIFGTAMGMNIMAVVGLVLAIRASRKFVTFPLARTFVPPILAGCSGVALRLMASSFLEPLPVWAEVIGGATLFTICYGATLLAIERAALLNEINTVWNALRKVR